jgi:hypothetical protein
MLLSALMSFAQSKGADLLKMLDEGNYSCVISGKDGIRTFNKSGVRDLYDLYTGEPQTLKGARMADKIIGKGAAALMVLGGVREVSTHAISESALQMLKAAKIKVSYEKTVYGIINRNKTDWCPLEKRLAEASTAEECRPLIEQFIADLNAGKVKLPEPTDRQYWAALLYKMAYPVLSNMAEGKLVQNMIVETSPTWDGRNIKVTYMECFGRLMAGLAPWLALPDDNTVEGCMRKELRELALKSYTHAVDPSSPDYLLWRKEGQTLVDAAYIAQSFLRAKEALWEPLDATTKARYIEEFTLLRRVDPPYINWLLFPAINEAFLLDVGATHDAMRVSVTVRKLREWYVGDGWYSDGEGSFHFDYYNSYVMHPMMVDVTETMARHRQYWWQGKITDIRDQAVKRCRRYAEQLERMISPEGTYPPIGRSLTYRTATFQPLALMALRHDLPEKVTPGQARAALTAVHKRIFADPSNFNEKGFLTIGFVGHHPSLGDWYSNNGSMYITSLSFLPLGLPADDIFWIAPAESWTSKKAFAGEDFHKDYPVDY